MKSTPVLKFIKGAGTADNLAMPPPTPVTTPPAYVRQVSTAPPGPAGLGKVTPPQAMCCVVMHKTSETRIYRNAQDFLNRGRYSEAFAIYEQLAKAGDPKCRVMLGWMYNKGLGVAKDREKARTLFKSAGDLGSGEGMF